MQGLLPRVARLAQRGSSPIRLSTAHPSTIHNHSATCRLGHHGRPTSSGLLPYLPYPTQPTIPTSPFRCPPKGDVAHGTPCGGEAGSLSHADHLRPACPECSREARECTCPPNHVLHSPSRSHLHIQHAHTHAAANSGVLPFRSAASTDPGCLHLGGKTTSAGEARLGPVWVVCQVGLPGWPPPQGTTRLRSSLHPCAVGKCPYWVKKRCWLMVMGCQQRPLGSLLVSTAQNRAETPREGLTEKGATTNVCTRVQQHSTTSIE